MIVLRATFGASRALAWLHCDHTQHLSIHSIVEVSLCRDDLITNNLKGIEHFQHPIATDKIGGALHHDDAARLEGINYLLHRNQGHAPTEENQIKSLLAEL